LNGGWVLILPDANEAYCHVWAEADTQKKAESYLNEYAEKIKQWQEKAEGAVVSMTKT
jgi:phosphomannomutase